VVVVILGAEPAAEMRDEHALAAADWLGRIGDALRNWLTPAPQG
jgi:hypothetical protein